MTAAAPSGAAAPSIDAFYGRRVPPTDDEVEAHRRRRGLWRYVVEIDGEVYAGLSRDGCDSPPSSALAGLNFGSATVRESWWALDEHWGLCDWPVPSRPQPAPCVVGDARPVRYLAVEDAPAVPRQRGGRRSRQDFAAHVSDSRRRSSLFELRVARADMFAARLRAMGAPDGYCGEGEDIRWSWCGHSGRGAFESIRVWVEVSFSVLPGEWDKMVWKKTFSCPGVLAREEQGEVPCGVGDPLPGRLEHLIRVVAMGEGDLRSVVSGSR